VLATVKNSTAEVILPNKVIYRSAFNGLDADVLLTYRSGALESDVIVRETPPDPASLGLSADSTVIEVVSTWTGQPNVQITPHMLQSGSGLSLPDSVIDFGEMKLWYWTVYGISGDRFDLAPALGSREIRVAKQWQQENGATILVEATSYRDCVPLLRALNDTGVAANRPGLVIDYVLITGGTSFTFQSGQTYWVTGSAGFSGPVVFQSGAIIKFNRNAFLYQYATVNNSISCQDGDLPIIFTAVDDNTVGEVLSGTPVSGRYAAEALWSYYSDHPITISRCDFRYCQTAVRCDANVNVTDSLNNCRFQDTTIGIFNYKSGFVNVIAANPIMCNVTTPAQGPKITLQGTITGCVPIGAMSTTAAFSGLSQGSILSGVVAVGATSSGPSPMIGGTLYVDGAEVDVDGNNAGNGSFSFTLDTTTYANGSHTLTVAAEDNGAVGTTGTDDTVRDATPVYVVANLSVTFNNALSRATVAYPDFFPSQGQLQNITGTWSSSRYWEVDVTPDGTPGTLYNSFTGSGSSININWNGNDSNGQPVPTSLVNYNYYDQGPTSGSRQRPGAFMKSVKNPIGQLGSFCVLYQGHHPRSAWRYGTPGGITFYVGGLFNTPSWGRLSAPASIAHDLAASFPNYGYYGGPVAPSGYRGDDNLTTTDLIPQTLGGSGALDNVDLGLFVGHSGQSVQNVGTLSLPEVFIPIYNKSSDSMSYAIEENMMFGGPVLKWLAFYSCNMFRDSGYRTGGSYFNLKLNPSGYGLPITTDLHIVQGYATEVSVDPLMGAVWLRALTKQTADSTAWTVLGAWKRVCRKTQPQNESAANENVCRSVYWPECAGDYITGYGPSTTPDPNNAQTDLLEQDEFATGP
jgi:hypothetical protein